MKLQSDIYTEVTEKIIAEMEKGALPWQCSWNQGLSMPLRSNGLAYRGINILI
ncbi:MAG: ArdC-like ssDNA-binding domain-containing protein, partial [Alphaproteobacteria bacterium]